MIGIAELKAHHQLSQRALDIHRQWDDLDAKELLPLVANLKTLTLPLSDLAGEDWHRKKKLRGHITTLEAYLQEDRKKDCWCDVKDLIYADLPALGFRLLTLAGNES